MPIQKEAMVAELAQGALLLPNLIADGLAANGRIKFALSWLQAVEAASGRDDRTPFADLVAERTLAGLDHNPLYDPPAPLERTGDGVRVPQIGAMMSRLLDDLSHMRAAVEAGAAAGLFDPAAAAAFRGREEALRTSLHLDGDILPAGLVSRLSRLSGGDEASFHGLVMEMHKAINEIAAGLAETDVAGARAYLLGQADRDRLAAFMHGLNRTAPLKFNHPGLATNAMRDGTHMTIQNDLGTTDAHVLIAQVEDRRLTIIHSDIHKQRLDFFQRHLPRFSWTVSNRHAQGMEDDIFLVTVGTFEAPDLATLDTALEELGASLVFLIDWNKARKSLGRFVPRREAVAILDWAADHEYGHRAYLEIGGEAVIDDLLETVSRITGVSYTSLQRALGKDDTTIFLRETLRIASETLRDGRSPFVIRDLLQAELMMRVGSVADRILDEAVDHAALILDLGNLVQATLLDTVADPGGAATRAKLWEALADRQVGRICDLSRDGKVRAWRVIASEADDAADKFEEVAFLLQFLPRDLPAELHERFLLLVEGAIMAVRDYVRLLCALRNEHQTIARRDMRAFMALLDRLHEHEHATDDIQRDLFTNLMHADVDARVFHVTTAVAGGLEEVADALLNAGRLVSDHAVGEWFAT
ncbi:hypothetical protein AA13595_1781 [Gluconacetobacter johannae DSM 13595]|uniref:DUF47 family protein n=1 Tax=Gluconacetobacter johannae TaxID=112140 RepID=A0A7W4J6F1_9PROT|nr:DUF47 family protein [Gluconacetobacter johannae]MBB2175608.1 DUF47 family protein [Gluconacetobacter johannae]GBQ85996.1 hypothetical protein AA13595_1781 [Gluconacetobacter johannae DSM 13595]